MRERGRYTVKGERGKRKGRHRSERRGKRKETGREREK